MDSRKARRNLLLLAPVALFPLVGIGVLYLFKDSSLKRAAADQAIYAAQTSPAVEGMLGLPIEPGWPIRGTAQANRTTGSAILQIPLRGSLSAGTLLEEARKIDGKWRLCSLLFLPKNGPQIRLAVAPGTPCSGH